MRVCIITSGMLDKRIDGTAGPAVKLAQGLSEQGFDVNAITNPGTKPANTSIKWHIIQLRPSNLPLLISMLRKMELDVIHVFGGPIATTFGAILAKITGKPVIQTVLLVHPRFYALPFYTIRKSIPDRVRFAGIRSLAHVICHSRYVFDFLVRIGYPKDRMTLIYPGVFFDDSLNESSKRSLNFGEKIVLFWTGANDKERGFGTFLESIPLVLEKVPEVQFCAAVLDFIGEGMRRKTFELAINTKRLYITENSTGKYLWEEEGNKYCVGIGSFIASSAVVALPFKINAQEPPFSLLQSMALGKAVVTTNLGANSEIISNFRNGVLIEPSDPVALANAIISLLRNSSLRRDIAEAAKQYIVDNYDWMHYCQGNSKIYETMMKK